MRKFLYGHVAKDGETPTHTTNGVKYVGETPTAAEFNAPLASLREAGILSA